MTTLTGDPDTLLLAARTLQRRAAGLDEATGRLSTSTAAATAGWSGAASVAFAARSGELGRALSDQAAALDCLGTSTAAYAERLRAAQERQRVLAVRCDMATPDQAARQQVWATPDPGGPAAGTPGMAAGDQARAQVSCWQAESDQIGAQARQDGSDLARALREYDPFLLLPASVREAARGAWLGGSTGVEAAGLVSPTRLLGSFWWHLAGARVARGIPGAEWSDAWRRHTMAAAHNLRGFVDDASRSMRLLPPGLQVLVAKGSLLATVVSGVVDVVRGDPEHPGWRSITTRVVGGAGAVGAGILLAGVGGPVIVAAAGTAVLAYAAWQVGTAVWDHRAQIASFARGAGRAAVRAPSVIVRGAARFLKGFAWPSGPTALPDGTAPRGPVYVRRTVTVRGPARPVFGGGPGPSPLWAPSR